MLRLAAVAIVLSACGAREPAPIAAIAPTAAPVADASVPDAAAVVGSKEVMEAPDAAAPFECVDGPNQPVVPHGDGPPPPLVPSCAELQRRGPHDRDVCGVVAGNGYIPTKAVKKVVEENMGRLRLCYEKALKTSPNLAGIVRVKFVINRNGDVSTAQDAGSCIADMSVVACVVHAFGNLSFPEPIGGIVTATYPIKLEP